MYQGFILSSPCIRNKRPCDNLTWLYLPNGKRVEALPDKYIGSGFKIELNMFGHYCRATTGNTPHTVSPVSETGASRIHELFLRILHDFSDLSWLTLSPAYSRRLSPFPVHTFTARRLAYLLNNYEMGY